MHITIQLTLLFSLNTFALQKVIYGKDNRKDIYEVRNSLYLDIAKSTAGLVSSSELIEKGDHFEVSRKITLGSSRLNLCSDERFSNQPLLPICSGFLIDEDIMITAGHCYQFASSCDSEVWVFDYRMSNASDIDLKTISKSNVYSCKKVIKQVFNGKEDFSIIQLDRKVTGRAPLKYRKSGKISKRSNLVVIGHPSGLPLKVSSNGRVISNKDKFQFTTSLDTFQGNSGSAVIDSTTGTLEGILVSGKTDYVLSRPQDETSCRVVNNCNMRGKSCTGTDSNTLKIPGENVTRITTIQQFLP